MIAHLRAYLANLFCPEEYTVYSNRGLLVRQPLVPFWRRLLGYGW